MWLLLAFTTCMSFHVGGICAAFYAAGKGATIVSALGITCLVFVLLTAYVPAGNGSLGRFSSV